MAKHKLVLEDVFKEVTYTLIAIHCSLEDYRLAYLLNKSLFINLNRKEEDLDFDNASATYSIFDWIDVDCQITWSLVNNVYREESEITSNTNSLFGANQKSTKTHSLISEYKNVDYFFKIDTEGWFSNKKAILNSIQKIPQVITAYTVDVAQLKSKNNLIFN